MFSVNQLRLGTITATDYCLGSIPVQKMYMGSVLVFDRTPAEETKYFFEVSPTSDIEFDALDSTKTLTVTSYSQVYSGDSPSGPVTPVTPSIQNPEFIINDIVNNEDGTFTITLKANDYYQDEDGSLSKRNDTITISQSQSGDNAIINVSQSPIVPTVQNRWLRLEYAAEEDQYITVNKSDVELPYVSDWKNYVFPKKSTGIKPIRWNAEITNQDFMHEVLAHMSQQTIVYVDEAEDAQENKSTYTAADNMCIATSNGDGLYFQELLKGSGIENGEVTFKIDGNGYWGQFYECFSGCRFNKVTIQFMQDNICISSMNRAFRAATIKELNILDSNGESSITKHFTARDLSGMCEWTSGITNFPDIIDWESLDNNSSTGLGWAFSYAIPLISITQHGSDRDATSNIVRCGAVIQAFQKCSNLQSIGPVLDVSRVPGQSSDNGKIFEGCTALTDVRIRNLNGPTWHFDDDIQSGNIPNLDKASVTYLFDNLMDLTKYNAEDTSGTKPKSDHGDLYCPAEWQDKITSEMIIAAAAKNWNIYVGGELQQVTEYQYVFECLQDTLNVDATASGSPYTVRFNSYRTTYINGVSQNDRTRVNFTADWHDTIPSWFTVDIGEYNGSDGFDILYIVQQNDDTVSREYTHTVTQIESGKTTSLRIVQSTATITYSDITITEFTYPDIAPASGSTLTPTLSYTQSWGYGDSTTDGGTITSGATLQFAGGAVNASNGQYTYASKGKELSEQTDTQVTVTVSLNGKTKTATANASQAANTRTLSSISVGNNQSWQVDAEGLVTEGTCSEDRATAYSTMNLHYSYSSGSTDIEVKENDTLITDVDWIKPYSNLTDFDILSRGTTIGDVRVGHVWYEYEEITSTKASVTQAANAITNTQYTEWTITQSNIDSVSAEGQVLTINPSIKRTKTDTYSSKATKQTEETSTDFTLQSNQSWAVVDNKNINVQQNTGDERSATITITSNGKSTTFTITQSTGQTITSYGDITIDGGSAADIPASGGKVKASGCTATIAVTYSSGSTGSVTVPAENITYTEVSAASLGTTAKARTKVGTSTCNVSYQGKSASKQIDVYQAANSRNETPGLGWGNYGNWKADASGRITEGTSDDNKHTAFTFLQLTYTYTSGSTQIVKIENITLKTDADWINPTDNSDFSVDSRGTVVGGERVGNVWFEYEGRSSTKRTVTQAANTATYANPVVSCTYTDIPASGGSVNPTSSFTQAVSYTSGSSSSVSTGGTWSYTNATNTSTGQVTASSKGTTESGKTEVKTVTANITVNGRTGSKQVVVYQQANTKTAGDIKYGDWQVDVSVNPNTIDSAGGTRTINRTASRTRTQTYNYTSGATSQEAMSNETGTPTLSSNQTWCTLNNNNATISRNDTTSSRTVTITGTYQGKSDTCTITQSARQVESYGDITISGGSVSGDIPASGGSKSASGCTATIRVNYDNDTYENVSVPSSNISYSSVSGSNLGTTAKARTKVGTSRCIVSYQGKTATKDFDVYQQANSSTAGDIVYGTWQVNVSANPTSIAVGGGTSTITTSASRTRKQNYTWTSGATSQSDMANETATPALSVSGTGFSLQGTTVTATSNVPAGGNEVFSVVQQPYSDLEDGPAHSFETEVNCYRPSQSTSSRTCTVTASHSGVTKSVTITQSGETQSEISLEIATEGAATPVNKDCKVDIDNSGTGRTKKITIHPIPQYGEKNDMFTVSTTITQTGSSKTLTIEYPLYKGYLNVSPTTLEFDSNGGTKTINIDTNLNWQVMP